MGNYLLIRKYKDGSIWTTTGSKKRIDKLHSYCNNNAYTDEIYLIQSDGIYKKVEVK